MKARNLLAVAALALIGSLIDPNQSAIAAPASVRLSLQANCYSAEWCGPLVSVDTNFGGEDSAYLYLQMRNAKGDLIKAEYQSGAGAIGASCSDTEVHCWSNTGSLSMPTDLPYGKYFVLAKMHWDTPAQWDCSVYYEDGCHWFESRSGSIVTAYSITWKGNETSGKKLTSPIPPIYSGAFKAKRNPKTGEATLSWFPSSKMPMPIARYEGSIGVVSGKSKPSCCKYKNPASSWTFAGIDKSAHYWLAVRVVAIDGTKSKVSIFYW